jgi:8-oxo-dGTP diphosphatase
MITCVFEDNGKGQLRHVVVDTLVIKDDKVLFVKRVKKLLEGGKWGLVGGFVGRDENLKQAVEREVYEETGYKIKDITLLAINDRPNRPHEDRQNISFVFFCKALEKEGKADWESDEQKWFPLSELPKEEEIAFDHYSDIQLYLRFINKEISIPVLE